MSFTLSLARLALRNARSYATHVGPRGAAAVRLLGGHLVHRRVSLVKPYFPFPSLPVSTLFFGCVIGDARWRSAPEGLYGYTNPLPFGVPSQ